MSDESQEREPPKWELVKEFFNESKGFWCVRVQRLFLYRPRYSLEIGRIKDGKFSRYFSPSIKINNSSVDMQPVDILALGQLIAEAESFIFNHIQDREDEIMWHKQRKEQREIDKNGDRNSSVGKGLSRFSKSRQQESKTA